MSSEQETQANLADLSAQLEALTLEKAELQKRNVELEAQTVQQATQAGQAQQIAMQAAAQAEHEKAKAEAFQQQSATAHQGPTQSPLLASNPSNLSTLVRPEKPPAYNGRSRPDTWLFLVQNYLRACNFAVNSAQAVYFAASLFRDNAAVWWQYMDQAIAGGSVPPIDSWEAFHKALLVEFQPQDLQRSARDKLENLKQQGPVVEYIRRVRELALQIQTMSSADLLHKFVRGLKPAVRKEVELKDPKSWDEAVRMAERTDAVLYSISKGNQQQGMSSTNRSNSGYQQMDVNANQMSDQGETRVCYYCKQPGHLKRNCKKRQANLLLKASRQQN